MTFDSIFELRRHLRIKEHSPGRLTLKISLAVLRDPALSDLPGFDRTPPGVHKVRFSMFSRTVTLDYDSGILPPELIEELVMTDDPDRGRDILARLEERTGCKLL